MNDLLRNDWFVNITGGLIVAVVIGVITSRMLPRWRRYRNRGGHDISGVWDVFDATGPTGTPSGTWTIRQNGDRVKVRIVRHTNRKGDQMWREFEATGTWHADQLCCTFRDLNGRHRTGAIVLRWMGSGPSPILGGKTLYWDRTPEPGEHRGQGPSGVVALPYTLRRRGSDRA